MKKKTKLKLKKVVLWILDNFAEKDFSKIIFPNLFYMIASFTFTAIATVGGALIYFSKLTSWFEIYMTLFAIAICASIAIISFTRVKGTAFRYATFLLILSIVLRNPRLCDAGWIILLAATTINIIDSSVRKYLK